MKYEIEESIAVVVLVAAAAMEFVEIGLLEDLVVDHRASDLALVAELDQILHILQVASVPKSKNRVHRCHLTEVVGLVDVLRMHVDLVKQCRTHRDMHRS